MRRNRMYETMLDGRPVRLAAPNMSEAKRLVAGKTGQSAAEVKVTPVDKASGGPLMVDSPTGFFNPREGKPASTVDGLADAAATFVRRHRSERQSAQLTSRQPVTLTIIQNEWAAANKKDKLDITTAPKQVMDAIETTERGHELFDRMRDKADGTIVYGLRRAGESR